MLRILLKSFNYLYLTVQCLNTGPLALVIIFIWVQMLKTTNSRTNWWHIFWGENFTAALGLVLVRKLFLGHLLRYICILSTESKCFAIWHAYILLVNIIEKNWLQVHIVSDAKGTCYFWKKTTFGLLREMSFGKSYKYCIVWSRMLKAALLTVLKAS